MALDPRFVVAPSLEMYFVDKDTGLPLANGIVTFYEDDNRTVLKPVYELSGSPPYSTNSFIELSNPIRLSAYGTFMDDNGNDIIPYYFPYEGTPDQTTNVVELYYITVESEGNVLQFTREAWPPNFSGSGSNVTSNDIYNFIPNGQFLAHNNISASSSGTPDGIITEDVTSIAQGGWFFVQEPGTTSVNEVEFIQDTSFQDSQPTSNPRYAVQISCTTFDALDTVKDLRVKFPNVNKFGSSDSTVLYTFSVTGKTTASSQSLNVYLVKNYGTGGDPETEELIGTVSFTPDYSIQNIAFSFGNNDGKTISTDNDDYVEIAVRFPVDQSFEVTMTDFVLASGDLDITMFPTQTDADMFARGVAGWMPTPDPVGMDLYLPMVLTREGVKFDDSEVGDVIAVTDTSQYVGSISTTGNRLLCYGDTYKTTDYSPLGIPYARLQSKLWNPTLVAPNFGCGREFVDTYINTTVDNAIRITTNEGGSATGAVDVSTTIVFSNIHTGAAYTVKGYVSSPSTVYVKGDAYGLAPTDATAGTSGFTVVQVKNFTSVRQEFYVGDITSAATLTTGAAGKYFTFTVADSTNYYMWFHISAETDPAPGGTGIRVNLTSTDDAEEVTRIIRESISGFTVTKGVVPAASAIPAGSYFTFSSPTTNYLAWFKKSGSGSDPNVAGKISVEIDINSTDTDDEVASAIQYAMNQAYFGTPNFAGMFLRGIDPDNVNDPGSRFGILSSSFGPQIGTFEFDEVQSHDHPVSYDTPHAFLSLLYHSSVAGPTNIANAGGDEYFGATVVVDDYGEEETRPINGGVIWAIKY